MITSYTVSRTGDTSIVRVSSSLTAPIWYWWFLDGAFVNVTRAAQYTFVLTPGEQATVECIDTSDNVQPSAPAGYPATRTIRFVTSLADTIARYCVQQQKNGGAWETIGYVQDNPGGWSYSVQTDMLDDLATYAWRVIPIDTAGNQGTALALGSELIVRTPDAPDFSFTFNAGAATVTFGAA